ncbi:hypothetical protein [Pleionea sediminis]|uniref:hypothetical protein n=1 Tax=Pleionea sediminis TaxID=2569479 RepID=UPI001185C6C3|nr:hypothetical protein [Pleionea sediminis]
MIEVVVAVAIAATIMALYQGFRGGFDYVNQARLEAKVNVVMAPRWLQAFMVLALTVLAAEIIYLWSTQVWLVALAITVGTFMISVSIKMLFMPRSESKFYERVFSESN